MSLHEQKADGTYWIEKLGPFRQGPRFLPNPFPSNDTRVSTATALCRPELDGASPIEVAGLAAVVLIVSRYNGGEPLIVASPAAHDDEGLRFFASGPWDETQSPASFLGRMREEIEISRGHQPWRWERVASALAVNAAAAQRGLLQLAFVVGEEAQTTHIRHHSGVVVRVQQSDRDVQVEVSATGWAYSPSLLPQLAAHIARAIEWLVAQPGARLRDFEMLSADERRQISHGFNDTNVVLPEGLTLHGLVAAQAARTPDANAVIYRDTELTYRSLEGQANHLAKLLRRDYGVTSGACVGVMMDRSDKMIVALYGVMKAGAAYVPINPRHPWETVRYMIENAGISVLIVDAESIAGASSFAGHLLVIDIELHGSPEADDPQVAVSDRDLAYVIYTSGSTGRPKGVAIEHRAVVNTILWRNAFYGISAADVNLQIPSFAFDSSVVDIFCVLTVGGTLVVPDEDMRLDARRLIELSAARRVTSCIVTPSYYKLLVGELAGGVPSLQWVTLAGESATLDLVSAHLKRMPGVGLYNEYGPTENAVCSTACRLEAVEATVPIGRPIWNVTVLILDGAGRLAPIGVPGEIYLGGVGLAREYLNQEQLTADRFIASPVPESYAGRLYKTGDRACWRPDGTIEFLGRLDSQVKIRGFRIELGEVEQAVRRHVGVSSAAVLCKQDAGGAKYLAAYVESPTGVSRAALREHLTAQVPHYMVPDIITVMPKLPLNLNGKIDHAVLDAIDDFSAQAEAENVPLSPVESTLVDLWTDVLKRSPIALDDNFFVIGGNSLRVMELTSRIRGELSLGIELLDIYTYPTVRELADRLREQSENAQGN